MRPVDPNAVLKALWRHKILAFLVMIVSVGSLIDVAFFGPRVYEASAEFVLISPKVPSELDLVKHPELGNLNSDNPVPSSDLSLAAQVVMAKLSSDSTVSLLRDQGSSADYTVTSGTGNGSSIIDITATAATPDAALAASRFVSDQLSGQLRSIQKVNGADDLYLISSLEIDGSQHAVERVSSRLRLIIVVAAGSLVILFGVMSVAHAVDNRTRESDQKTVAPNQPSHWSKEQWTG